jgi:ABC-type uncharacterized transport system substrate-binding protein
MYMNVTYEHLRLFVGTVLEARLAHVCEPRPVHDAQQFHATMDDAPKESPTKADLNLERNDRFRLV